MAEATLEMTGQGGVKLHRAAFHPKGEPRATVVVAHGAGEHLAVYGHVFDRLTGAGYVVHALDHRGHGRSEGKRADIEGIDEVVADLRSLIALARAEQPDRKLFLLGHSMGGCISLTYAIRHGDEIDGLILSSALTSQSALSAPRRTISKILGKIAPSLGVYQVDTKLISRDPAEVRRYEEDPLIHHGKLPARTVSALTSAVEAFPGTVGSLDLPLLVFHGSADRITEPAGTREVHRSAGSADKTIEIFEGLYHECLNEPEREQVMDLIVGWLDQRA